MLSKNLSGCCGYLTEILEVATRKFCSETVKQRCKTAKPGLGLARAGETYVKQVGQAGQIVIGSALSRCVTLRLRPTIYVNNISYHTMANYTNNLMRHADGATFNKVAFFISREFSDKKEIASNDLKKEIDNLTDKFMEAQELLQDAIESKETVYFNDDLKDATEAVDETLETYSRLLENLTEEQRQNVMRTIGLKMEELKAHKNNIEESLKHE